MNQPSPTIQTELVDTRLIGSVPDTCRVPYSFHFQMGGTIPWLLCAYIEDNTRHERYALIHGRDLVLDGQAPVKIVTNEQGAWCGLRQTSNHRKPTKVVRFANDNRVTEVTCQYATLEQLRVMGNQVFALWQRADQSWFLTIGNEHCELESIIPGKAQPFDFTVNNRGVFFLYRGETGADRHEMVLQHHPNHQVSNGEHYHLGCPLISHSDLHGMEEATGQWSAVFRDSETQKIGVFSDQGKLIRSWPENRHPQAFRLRADGRPSYGVYDSHGECYRLVHYPGYETAINHQVRFLSPYLDGYQLFGLDEGGALRPAWGIFDQPPTHHAEETYHNILFPFATSGRVGFVGDDYSVSTLVVDGRSIFTALEIYHLEHDPQDPDWVNMIVANQAGQILRGRCRIN